MFRYPENSYKMQMGELNEFLKTNYPDVISTFNSFYNQLSDTNKINEEYYLKTFEIDGIPVVMKNAHGIYLFGMEVNYSDGLNARGFVFNNPNASSSCGCGSSFAV